MELRFIERDGRKILQQEHFLPIYFDPKDPESSGLKYGDKWPKEWRDVPLVKEEDKASAD